MARKTGKIIVKITMLIIALSCFLIVLSNYLILKNADGRTFSDVSLIENNKVGLVLGTSKWLQNGKINLYFEYRVQAAVELFNYGKIEFILVSGDNSTKSYDEPNDFKEELVKRGIPEEKIYLDYAGFRTLDSLVRAKVIFGQAELTIISQKFHNERAIYLAEKKGISAIGYNARDANSQYGFKTRVREYFARTKACLDIWFGVEPKFLGRKIKIALQEFYWKNIIDYNFLNI